MDVGYFAAHEQHDPNTLVEHAVGAEQAGFDRIWVSDHAHPWWHTGAHCGAAWPWLGSALERTQSVGIGTGVTPPISRYHPALIAQVFATLETMYPGRVHLTIGTGEAMNEVPLGYGWPGYPERRQRLIEACEIISRLWSGGFQSYSGTHWSIDTMQLYTLPDDPVPLYVAANGPQSTRVAGQYADGLLTLRDPETYENDLAPDLDAAARDAGRDPATIKRIRQVGVSYAESHDHALEATGFWRGPRAIGFHQDISDPREIEERGRDIPLDEMADAWLVTTDPADIVEAIERSAAVGFDEIEFLSTSPDQDQFIEMMAEEVLPTVEETGSG